jgi:hypothetical protein
MLKEFTVCTTVYASQQQSYFLIVFICEHKYNTSVVDIVNSLISWHRAYVCTPSPVSAGAPVGQRTTSGGNTCADTPDLSFYGHIGGLGCSARKKSKIFGTFSKKIAQKHHKLADI